jgi:hypothetical protein
MSEPVQTPAATRWDGPVDEVLYTTPREPGHFCEVTSLPDRLLPTVGQFGIVVPTDSKKRGKRHVEVGTVATWELIALHIHHGLRHPAFRAHIEAELARVPADPSVVRTRGGS